MNSGRRGLFLLLLACCATGAVAAPQTVKVPGASVTYDGISTEQAGAIARTLAAARVVYAEQLKFDVPDTVTADVTCRPGNATRLFNDGRAHVSLSIASADSLARPAKSGVFHLYGLCHEMGHVAMYRTLKDRDWLTGAGAEGWAHYAGSVVVDRVWAAEGQKLWADAYDYRADGTARLNAQVASKNASDVDRVAGHWRELAELIKPESFPTLFAAWQKANSDPADPEKKLLAALVEAFPEKRASLEKWWQSAASVLVQKRPGSAFERVEIDPSKLEGKPIMLKGDDDGADGKRSIAGGGHARQFEAPAEGEWYLRSVSIHGARYGPAAPPADQFDVALCDAEMRPIAVWRHPYGAFERGQAKWFKVATPATRLPGTFYVCAVFRPTARSGVFVDFDSSTQGHSRVATPGAAGEALGQGDWMIRVEIDRAKGADALR
jgi:hypothetical protein